MGVLGDHIAGMHVEVTELVAGVTWRGEAVGGTPPVC